MNPLNPSTYYRRHKGQALLLLVLIGSLTLGVYTMARLGDDVPENARHMAHYLTRMSRLTTSESPKGALSQMSPGGVLDPGIAAQIRAHPDVAAVLPENGLYIMAPVGLALPFPVLGVTEADLPAVMEACNLRLKEGRLISPRAGEVLLSEELARALKLQIGDRFSHETNADYFPVIATELTLVGVLESGPSDAGPEVRAGFVSYEYLEAHELYQPRATNWLILPRQGSRVATNEFVASLLEESAESASVHLETFEGEAAWWEQAERISDTVFGLMDGLVAVAVALVVGMVHCIAVAYRLPELGLLHAAGYPKRRLARRLVLEVATIACVGWAIGLLCAHAFSILLNNTLYAARGWSMNLATPSPLLHTLPIPLVVIAWIHVTVNRTLNRLDPVAIIERGKLSMEEAGGRRQEARSRKQGKARSSRNPLSSSTFYLRHRRRSMSLVAAIGLMVLSVALPVFFTTEQNNATLPAYLSYTSHTAVVSPGYTYRAIPSSVIAQIKAHPAVAHAIPAKALRMMASIPMQGEMMSIPVYAVREQDLPTLLDVYGLRLGEGELVQPRSGQIVLTSALARNRGLDLGDAVGHPVHERDGIPTELTVVGLLESANSVLVEREVCDIPPMPRWVAFASYEYVDSHERYAGVPTHELVVPVAGRESEMEMWLEETIASPQAKVETLATSYELWWTIVRFMLLFLVINEAIMTTVAAGALAILNYMFIMQRRDEFGVLHAAGHSRARLIGRTLRESIGIAVVAWLIGAACCLVLVLAAQAVVYAPIGTSLDLTNPTPWLFTLPIPLAVVAASAGTTGWALKRLDPVAVIERR